MRQQGRNERFWECSQSAFCITKFRLSKSAWQSFIASTGVWEASCKPTYQLSKRVLRVWPSPLSRQDSCAVFSHQCSLLRWKIFAQGQLTMNQRMTFSNAHSNYRRSPWHEKALCDHWPGRGDVQSKFHTGNSHQHVQFTAVSVCTLRRCIGAPCKCYFGISIFCLRFT